MSGCPNPAARRLFLLKIFAYIDYAMQVSGTAFVQMYMATLGFPIEHFFKFAAVAVVTALVSQNIMSRISDRIGNRLPFVVMAKLCIALAISSFALFPTLAMSLIYAVLANALSGEVFLVAIVYELIDEKQSTSDSDSSRLLNKSGEYAKYRVFGSIGWAWTAPFSGWAISALNGGTSGIWGYQIMFIISAVGIVTNSAFLYSILHGYTPRTPPEIKDPHVSNNNEVKSTRFYRTPVFLILILSSFVFQIGLAFGNNAFAPFLKRGLGTDATFLGLLMFTWANCEIPLFYLSSYVAQKCSWQLPVLLGFGFQVIKMSTYAFIVTPNLLWVVVVVQFFNQFGISFPAVTYGITNTIAPQRKALGTSLYQTINLAGGFVGSLLGTSLAISLGPEAETLTGYKMFFIWSAILAAAAIGLFWIFHILVQYSKRKTIALAETQH